MTDNNIAINNNAKYMVENRQAIKEIANILKKMLNESLTTEEKLTYIKQLENFMNDRFTL